MKRHASHHLAVIPIRPFVTLDPNPLPRPAAATRLPAHNQGFALLELQAAAGNVLTMSKLRALLPVTSAGPALSDADVIVAVAALVKTGHATLKFTSPDPGKLPWPEILKDLGGPEFEGTIPHMYSDNRGNVTVGVGTMLASVAEAQDLGFTVRKTNKPATRAEIAADYNSVLAQWKLRPNLIATLYKTDLDLPQAEIDRMLKVRVERSAQQLASRFRCWPTLPVDVKRALIDMRYNMNENMDKYTTFQADIEKAAQTGTAGDWQAAAKDSNRAKPVSAVRNKWTSDMILRGGGVIQ